jgi:hypothetical protein
MLELADPFVILLHLLQQRLHVELFFAPEVGIESPYGHARDPGDLP